MKTIKLFALAIFVSASAGIFVPVLAQDNPDSRRADTERYDDDHDTNYSWIGLIGLLGLAGLYKRPTETRTERDSINSGQVKVNPRV